MGITVRLHGTMQYIIELIRSTKNDLLNIRNENSWTLLQEKSLVIVHINKIYLRKIKSGKVNK